MKKITFYIAMLSIVSFLGTSCSTQADHSVKGAIAKSVDSNTFKKMMDEGKFVAIDVRKPAERLSDNIFPDLNKPYGYIPGTQLNIDWKDQASFKAQIEKLDKSKPYGVYCRSGHRSGNAMAYMKKAGFKEVYNLDHGMKGWLKAGLPNKVIPK